MLRPGDIVGDYEVLDELNSGGMGTLFLARRSGAAGFERRVAIKIIHPHLARDPGFVRLFIDEALLAAQIDHPNVVRVDELREAAGTYFQVMEYVPGCSLAQLLRALARLRRRLSPAVAVAIAAQVAEGLHAAHEAVGTDGRPLGVVHRDVSPQNVLLGEAGQVKLIDFGVAKARGRERTATGHLRGKLRYMAPEQTHSGPIDRRADLYALGAVLWEMLTFRHFHETDNQFELLARVRAPRALPPGRHVQGIPPALDAAVMAALEPDPARRPPDARALRARLLDAVPGAVEVDPPRLAALLLLVSGHHGEGCGARDEDATASLREATLATSTLEIVGNAPIAFDDEAPAYDPPDGARGSVAPAAPAPAREAPPRRARGAGALAAWVAVAAIVLGAGAAAWRLAGHRAGPPTAQARGTAPESLAAPASPPSPAASAPSPPSPSPPPPSDAPPPAHSGAQEAAARRPHGRATSRTAAGRRRHAPPARRRLVHGVPLADEVTR